MKSLLTVITSIFCCSFLLLSPALAQSESGGISIIGTGTVNATPTIVELEASIKGDGEIAGDAVTKYQSNKRRAEKILKGLNIKGLSLEPSGMAMANAMGAQSMQQMMNGMPNNNAGKFKLALAETMTIRLNGIDKLKQEELLDALVKIIETGIDSGLTIGGSPTMAQIQRGNTGGGLVTFKLANIADLKKKALALAMKDAREQAEELAELGGVKLGPVISMSQTPIAEKSNNNSTSMNYYYTMMMGMMGGSTTSDDFSSAVLKEIPISVKLQVTFAIQK